MHYVLSPYYQLKKLAYLKEKHPNTPEIEMLGNTGHFILVKRKKKDFIINREIYQFLYFLKEPRTLDTLKTHFPLEPNLANFLQNMLKKGVVIDASRHHQLSDWSTAKPRFAIGDKVGEYSIIKLLNSKKEVEIYLAEYGQKVIIKALKIPPYLSKEKIQKWKVRFCKEFKLMQALPKNPYLSELIDFQEKEAYGVLKFVEGKTLHQFLRTEKPNSEIKAHLIPQLIKAVAFLHHHHIVHGDLHHSNIIVSESNKITLLDFGLSHFHRNTTTEKLRKGGLEAYLPPERINQSAFQTLTVPANFVSDIYQLGILMYLIIFQKFPFTGFTWNTLYSAIQKGAADYTLADQTLANFIPVIKKCLSKNPLKRYENANTITVLAKLFDG